MAQRAIWGWALFAGLLAVESAGVPATQANETAQRAAAMQLVPFDRLTPQASEKILAIMEKPSLFRRVPPEVTQCDPDMFMHCVRSPEVVINIWQLMGVTTVDAKRTGNFSWSGTDGAGTTGDVELIYGSERLHVMYCDGYYEGPLLRRKILGKAVMLLQTTPTVGEDKAPVMTSQLDVFLQFENAGADIIAKTLSPLIASTADANFTETVSFVSKLSQASERNGPGMQNLAGRLQNVQANVRQEFARTAALVNQRAATRTTSTQSASTMPQSPEDLGLQPEDVARLPGARTR